MDSKELETQLKNLSCKFIESIDQKIKNNINYYKLDNNPKGRLNKDFEINLNNKFGFVFSITNTKYYELIKETYFKLLDKSYEEDYYFFGCTLDVAIQYYNNLTDKLPNKIKGIDDVDLLKEQLAFLKNDYSLIKEQNTFDAFFKNYKESFTFDYDLAPYIVLEPVEKKDFEVPNWQNEYYKKIEYLKTKIKYLKKEKLNNLTKTKTGDNKGIVIPTSTKEKLILLEELGIIQHINQLDNNNANASKIARVLARLTGENTENLRRSLNSLLREDIGDKNHPYYVQSNIESVHVFLEKEGIKTKNNNE